MSKTVFNMATDCLRDDFYLWDSGSAASIQYRFPNAGLPVSNVPDRRFHRTGIFINMNGKDLVMRMLRTIADTQEYRHYPQNINP